MNKIMVVEDELDLRNFLTSVLEENNYIVQSSYSGALALTEIPTFKPDLILLDQNLPDMKGSKVLEAIKKNTETLGIPVIILTAVSHEESVVGAFDLGADDYVEKPFSVSVLLRRIKAILKRNTEGRRVETKNIFFKDGLQLDCDSYKVKIDENPLETTLMEFNILKELFKANGKALSRDDLINRISGTTAVTQRTIDVHICSIRKKLNAYGKNIETIRGIGYRLQS